MTVLQDRISWVDGLVMRGISVLDEAFGSSKRGDPRVHFINAYSISRSQRLTDCTTLRRELIFAFCGVRS